MKNRILSAKEDMKEIGASVNHSSWIPHIYGPIIFSLAVAITTIFTSGHNII